MFTKLLNGENDCDCCEWFQRAVIVVGTGVDALAAFLAINAANAAKKTTIKPYNLLKYCRQYKDDVILEPH